MVKYNDWSGLFVHNLAKDKNDGLHPWKLVEDATKKTRSKAAKATDRAAAPKKHGMRATDDRLANDLIIESQLDNGADCSITSDPRMYANARKRVKATHTVKGFPGAQETSYDQIRPTPCASPTRTTQVARASRCNTSGSTTAAPAQRR